MRARHSLQVLRDLLALRDDERGDRERADRGDPRGAQFGRHGVQVIELAFPQDLNPAGLDERVVPGQGEPRPLDSPPRDDAIEPVLAGDRNEAEVPRSGDRRTPAVDRPDRSSLTGGFPPRLRLSARGSRQELVGVEAARRLSATTEELRQPPDPREGWRWRRGGGAGETIRKISVTGIRRRQKSTP